MELAALKQESKESTPESPSEMPFLEHLQELRSRVFKSALAIFIAAVACFAWASEIFALISLPLKTSFTNAELIGTGPAEAFLVKLKVALVAGLITSCPVSFYQFWRFVAPGLHNNERKLALPFIAFSTLFFLTGVTFCYFIIFPYAFDFFAGEFISIGVNPSVKIGEYLSFATKLILVFGVVFELPVLTFFLARLGLVTHTWLIAKARYAIVVVFICAALLTPPDLVTQLLLAVPLVILYGLCIVVARIFGKSSSTAI